MLLPKFAVHPNFFVKLGPVTELSRLFDGVNFAIIANQHEYCYGILMARNQEKKIEIVKFDRNVTTSLDRHVTTYLV